MITSNSRKRGLREFTICLFNLPSIERQFRRRLEAGTSEELGDVYRKLLQVGVGKIKSEKRQS